MDPNALLEELLELSGEILDGKVYGEDDYINKAEDLAEKITNLDTWIRGGGFLPKRWSFHDPRRLTDNAKTQFRQACRTYLEEGYSTNTLVGVLSTWIFGLIENAHLYPDWFEKKEEKS